MLYAQDTMLMPGAREPRVVQFPLKHPLLAWAWLALLRMGDEKAKRWLGDHGPEATLELGQREYDAYVGRESAARHP